MTPPLNEMYILLHVIPRSGMPRTTLHHSKASVANAVELLSRTFDEERLPVVGLQLLSEWRRIEDRPEAWNILCDHTKILQPVFARREPNRFFYSLVYSVKPEGHFALCMAPDSEAFDATLEI